MNTVVTWSCSKSEDVKKQITISQSWLQTQKVGVLKLAEIFNAQDISFKQILKMAKKVQGARVVIITHKINKAQRECFS